MPSQAHLRIQPKREVEGTLIPDSRMKPYFHPAAPLRRLTALFLTFALATSAPADPVITDITVTDTLVTLSFTEDGPGNQFAAQKNPNLDPANWTTDASATLAALGGGVFTLTLNRSAAGKEFFRVISSFLGTGLDRDGDGLPNALEESLSNNSNSPFYSDPDKFDTDGDGFSDSQEYAFGTEPNNASDFPDQALLPIVEFSADSFIIQEGDPSASITLETNGFSGSVTLTTAAEFDPDSSTIGISTAKFGANEDHTFSSPTTISANGSNTVVTVPVVDDLDIDSTYRFLFIDIAPGLGYRRGGNRRTAVLIEDNDAFWTGGLQIGNSVRNFRVQLLQSGSTQQANFVSGAALDGLTKPEDSTSSNASGVIPEGVFAADLLRQ